MVALLVVFGLAIDALIHFFNRLSLEERKRAARRHRHPQCPRAGGPGHHPDHAGAGLRARRDGVLRPAVACASSASCAARRWSPRCWPTWCSCRRSSCWCARSGPPRPACVPNRAAVNFKNSTAFIVAPSTVSFSQVVALCGCHTRGREWWESSVIKNLFRVSAASAVMLWTDVAFATADCIFPGRRLARAAGAPRCRRSTEAPASWPLLWSRASPHSSTTAPASRPGAIMPRLSGCPPPPHVHCLPPPDESRSPVYDRIRSFGWGYRHVRMQKAVGAVALCGDPRWSLDSAARRRTALRGQVAPGTVSTSAAASAAAGARAAGFTRPAA